MVTQTKEMKKLSRVGRFLFRLPIFLYRHNLGWIFGQRLLLLTHTGRKSGKARYAVIEVVSSDPETGVYYVTAAWGDKADWWLNLQADPHCKVDVGRKHFEALGRQVPADRAEEVLLRYVRKHPMAIRELSTFMGFQVDGSEEQYRQLARQLVIVGLTPQ